MVLSALAVFIVNIDIYGRFVLTSIQAGYFFHFPPISQFSGTYILYMALAILPGLLVSSRATRPSDYLFLLLYFLLYIPSIAFFAMQSSIFNTEEIFATLIFSISFNMLLLKNVFPVRRVSLRQTLSRRFWWAGISVLIGGMVLAALIFGEYGIKSFTENVYERRRYIKEGLTDIPAFIFYICNWLGSAIAPVLTVIGLARKSPTLVLLGLLSGILSFTISTHKINALTAIVTGLFYLFLRRKATSDAAAFRTAVYFILTFVYFIPWMFSMVTGDILLLWTTTFRIALNNGFLSATYIEFFSDLPLVFYADSFMSSFFESPLPEPISKLAGGYVSTVADNNANASFLADGYANMGLAGMFFASAQCIFLMWLFDMAAVGKNRLIASALAVSPALVLANTSVHTSLSSNGIFLLIVLIWMLPAHSPKKDTAGKATKTDVPRRKRRLTFAFR